MIGAMPVMPGMLTFTFTAPRNASIEVYGLDGERLQYNDKDKDSAPEKMNCGEAQKMNYSEPPRRVSSSQFLDTMRSNQGLVLAR